jgi:ABC-type multidrug transport system ATPase subunit
LAILKKGSIVYEGDRTSLLRQTKNHVWICRTKNEEEFENIQKQYIISSKKYIEEGIEARIISEKTPDISCRKEEVTLEDAYLSVMNF